MAIKDYVVSFKSHLKECQRVLTITKKPSNDEFKMTVKVAGLGLLLIGFIGFLIHYIASALKG